MPPKPKYDGRFADLLAGYLGKADRNASWLAAQLGMNRAAVGRWLNGERHPNDTATLVNLCEALGIDDTDERRALFDAAGFVYHAGGVHAAAPAQQGQQPQGTRLVAADIIGSRNVIAGDNNSQTVITHHYGSQTKPISPPYLNQAPAPPTDFVPRPIEYNQLLDLLLTANDAPVAITAALRGAGGYGKTTLAQKLCHDPQVIKCFPEGILWVELKEEPGDLTGRLLDIVEALASYRPQYRGLDAVRPEFEQALGERRLLLVIDDVWQASHLEPFLHGGSHCTRLVTSRIDSVLPDQAARVSVDAMAAAEAVALLGAGLRAADPATLKALAVRLGEWPLLLRLANGALRSYARSNMDSAEALAAIDAELTVLGLTAFDNPNDADNRNHAVAASLGVSLRRLDDTERRRFADLAVFPEDVDVPLAAIEKLWGVSPVATRRLCQRLGDLSLLLKVDFAARTIRIHDVVRSHLLENTADLPALHWRLLDAYSIDEWSQLSPDEPYLWNHLAYHLVQAGRTAELRELFADDRWLQARVPHDGYIYDGYIADLMAAWQLAHAEAERQVLPEECGGGLADCVRFALIRTSINSLAANYVPELVAQAVAVGL
jgi:hypothetical protein